MNEITSIGVATSRREHEARAEIVRDIVRAKHDLGLRNRDEMRKSFFKEIWPDILRHLKETGYKVPK